jgi:hypothetical protein
MGEREVHRVEDMPEEHRRELEQAIAETRLRAAS